MRSSAVRAESMENHEEIKQRLTERHAIERRAGFWWLFALGLIWNPAVWGLTTAAVLVRAVPVVITICLVLVILTICAMAERSVNHYCFRIF